MTLVCEDFSQRKTTKKGDRRKTVSSRRAYVNTPSQIIKRLKTILLTSGVMRSPESTGAIWKLIKDLER
jgi:hypothetical protein